VEHHSHSCITRHTMLHYCIVYYEGNFKTIHTHISDTIVIQLLQKCIFDQQYQKLFRSNYLPTPESFLSRCSKISFTKSITVQLVQLSSFYENQTDINTKHHSLPEISEIRILKKYLKPCA